MNHDNARFYIGSHFDASGRSDRRGALLPGCSLARSALTFVVPRLIWRLLLPAQIRDPPTHRNHEGHAGDGLFPRLTLSAQEAELLNAEALF